VHKLSKFDTGYTESILRYMKYHDLLTLYRILKYDLLLIVRYINMFYLPKLSLDI